MIQLGGKSVTEAIAGLLNGAKASEPQQAREKGWDPEVPALRGRSAKDSLRDRAYREGI